MKKYRNVFTNEQRQLLLNIVNEKGVLGEAIQNFGAEVWSSGFIAGTLFATEIAIAVGAGYKSYKIFKQIKKTNEELKDLD